MTQNLVYRLANIIRQNTLKYKTHRCVLKEPQHTLKVRYTYDQNDCSLYDKIYSPDRRHWFNSFSTRDEKTEFSNSVDLDEVAHNEPLHLDLHCLPSSL